MRSSLETGRKAVDQGVNARVKQVRLALGLSQAQFCRGVFLTNGHYAGIELGNRRVNDRVIKLIAVIYGVNEGFLRTGQGEMFDRRPDTRLERLLRDFQELPPDFQDFVLQQIEALKNSAPPSPRAEPARFRP
ncbi:MAG: helix-turn-helix transcriptional regulator [Treponematales bacterium]